jgi:hypothetical protein
LISGLFIACCLLSVVSYYTTQQGMALYLSTWFSILASLGIQTALVLVAWLVGFTRAKRSLLIAVYAITALVSIAFSYVSLFTWFSERERPAMVQRQLYDQLGAAAAKTDEALSAAIAETRKHVVAIDEMTEAERAHGFISRAQDSDPYLAAIREAVALEARTYDGSYREGAGQGVRYSAFDRHAKLARQSLAQLESARASVAAFRTKTKPSDSSEQQLRTFHEAYDAVPWLEIEKQLHEAKPERPAVPAYSAFVDKSASKQEDLMLAFQALVQSPDSRSIFSLLLAAFIDIVIFLLAYASGPHFQGTPEQRWSAAGAAMESLDNQVFVRGLLRKMSPGHQGNPRVEASVLTPGELQLCMLLQSRGLATLGRDDSRLFYLIEPSVHETLVESLSRPGLPLRAAEVRETVA